MSLARLNTALTIVLSGHVLNWPWRTRLERRRCRGEVIHRSVLNYLSRYSAEIQNFTVEPDMVAPTPETERIFTVWLQGEDHAPEIVRACLRSIRRHCRQELVVLDENSLGDWIELPQYIVRKWKAGKIRPAHFTDICRTELIYRHGGVWLDATDFVTRPVPEEIMKADFFIYLSGNTLKGSYAFVQNCFFRAVKGNYLLGAWNHAIQTYWLHEESIVDYFAHQLLFELTVRTDPKAGEMFAGMIKLEQDPTHALWLRYKDLPFSQQAFEEVTAGAFFQKTDYKSESAVRPVPGSFADIMLKM